MSNEDHHPEQPGRWQPNPERTDPPSRFRLTRGEWVAMAAVLVFYAATRLYGIAGFPIYFFCDEALQANLAHDLVVNDFRDTDGTLCPAYFRNVRVFNLGLSVWIQSIPVTVFGKTVLVVRTTSVVVGLFGAAALMLALKWFFAVRLWWAGGLVMAALPAWFLHSRTAFETVMMVSFYAVFVLTYLLYREVSAWWSAAAVASGAATFYSYSNGQGVMFITCLLLLIVDWRYHWRVVRRHPRAAAAGLVMLLLVAGPYLRFRFILHPEMMELHLEDLESYWIRDIPTADKLEIFARTYARGVSPGYWFTEDVKEIERHRMLGYPHLPLWLAPAVFIGLAAAIIRSRRSAAHRLVLIAVLAAPFSASLVGLRITRVLAMVVPATLSATIGLDQLRAWLAKILPDRLVQAAAAIGLTACTLAMTRDALINGPTWFQDYGLYGMQWGSTELFTEVRERLAAAPADTRIVISHLWANNTLAIGEFFLDPAERQRVQWMIINDVLRERRREVNPKTLFVFTPLEFAHAQKSPKLVVDPDYDVIEDPAGEPAFYLVRLAYTHRADEIFAAEREERRRLVDGTVIVNGTAVAVRHPKLDQGTIADAFDGNLRTLARTVDGNPTDLAISFAAARPVRGVRLSLWTDRYNIDLRAIRADGDVTVVRAEHINAGRPDTFEVLFDDVIADVVRLDLHIAKRGDVHVHMREIEVLD